MSVAAHAAQPHFDREAQARMLRLRERLSTTTEDERVLRVMLVLAHELVHRDALAEQALAAARDRRFSPMAAASGMEAADYRELIGHMHRVAATKLPTNSKLLVVSRGDEELLVPGFPASHFPQGPSGVYAGHYPLDSDAAILHLEQCRADGSEFLLLPATAFWWLDYYSGLLKHLMARARVFHHDDRFIVFDLRASSGGEPQA